MLKHTSRRFLNVKDFIRGLMDGDGYVSIRPGRKTESNPNFLFGIVGTFDICIGVQKWLSEKLILDPNQKLRRCKSIFGMGYAHNKDIRKIYNYLYPDGENTEMFLTRKHDKFKQVFNYNYRNFSPSYEEKLKSKLLV